MSKEQYLKEFALKVFKNADDEDRSMEATKNTAKAFLHASVFLECLAQYNTISQDILEKIKYSKWRNIEILTAIKEGRDPLAPQVIQDPETENLNEDVPDAPVFSNDSKQIKQNFNNEYSTDQKIEDQKIENQKIENQNPSKQNQTNSEKKIENSNSNVEKQQTHSFGFTQFIKSSANKNISPSVDVDKILLATKFSKNAISALQFDDVESAIQNLKSALETLEKNN